MKKVQMKRTGVDITNPRDHMKPFNFCCNIHRQDPDTRYDMRIPPMITSLTNIAPNNKEGPDLKFRLQDIAKQDRVMTVRSGVHKVKSYTQMGRGKRGRGPLQWYLEDEIALARDMIATEKEEKRKKELKKRQDLLKVKKHGKRKKSKNRTSTETEKNQDNESTPSRHRSSSENGRSSRSRSSAHGKSSATIASEGHEKEAEKTEE